MRKIITVESMSATMITSLMHVQSYPITTCTPGQEKNQERREKMANRKLTCVSYIIMPDGKTKLLEELTDAERAQWQ